MRNRMSISPLQFTDLDEDDVTNLWTLGAHQDGWPQELLQFHDFRDFVRNAKNASNLRMGSIKGIIKNGCLIGFTTLHEANPGFYPADELVFEGGTYLLPRERGKGFNLYIKEYLIKSAFGEFDCSWCIFCIPVVNTRARAAIQKLKLPFDCITLQDSSHPLAKYLKWKTWKENKPFTIYGMKKSSFNVPSTK